MSVGGRNKGAVLATRTLKEGSKVRYSKEDYLKMVEDRGVQNLAMSKNSPRI